MRGLSSSSLSPLILQKELGSVLLLVALKRNARSPPVKNFHSAPLRSLNRRITWSTTDGKLPESIKGFWGAQAQMSSMAGEGMQKAVVRGGDAVGPPLSLSINGGSFEVVAESGVSDTHLRKAIESVPFQRWLENMKGPKGILTLGGSGGARCSLRHVVIQSVDMFGQRVGFVKFKAEVFDDLTGAKLPGIVFARGGAVAILMLLECEGQKYAVLTEQARVPVGRTILELPAGMLDDDDGDFVGTAAREVEEETGIHIKTSELVDLTALLDESTGRRMFPSPGGSDEEITLLLYRGYVKQEVISSLQGQETGLRDHGELIKVHVVPYNTLWRSSPDAKALAAIALYEMALKLNLLPLPPNAPELSAL
ncbi:hypothetical protein CY35_10G007400 [Sphagnum magellanicum]|nr:hypothetical protein CY35_10G007400 [Sphagnum magellanicum]